MFSDTQILALISTVCRPVGVSVGTYHEVNECRDRSWKSISVGTDHKVSKYRYKSSHQKGTHDRGKEAFRKRVKSESNRTHVTCI